MLILVLKDMKTPLLFNKAVYYIGNVSYTLYLSHFVVIYAFNTLNWFNIFHGYSATAAYANFIYNYLIGLAGSFGIAAILHYSWELPMQNVGKKIINSFNKL
jgi:peptidoglycan/LPS O-acetylase OafA/YrhL